MNTYTTRPLSDRSWFRALSQREVSRFTASWSDTLTLLYREVDQLRGKHLVIGCDITEGDLRLDGQIRANARAVTPAVEVAFESKHGPLLYRCDRFAKPTWRRTGMQEDWQHNVRAVAMTLEALRAVDRYAATASGEQYRGYRALPAGRGDTSGMTTTDAARVIMRAAGFGLDDPADRPTFAVHGARVVRAARAATHPDRNGGDTGQWNLVDNAEQSLRRAGWIFS